MEFIFVTEYDQKAYTTIAKVVRKTIRRSLHLIFYVSYCAVYTVILLGVIVPQLDFRDEEYGMLLGVMIAPMVVVFALMLIFPITLGDHLNGFLARRQALPGTSRATAVFTAESYTITTDASKADFYYSGIDVLAETTDYFVFVLGKNHAVILSKAGMSKGSPEAFRQFIEEKTNKKIIGISLSKTHPSH